MKLLLLDWLSLHDGHPRVRREHVDDPTDVALVFLVCLLDWEIWFVDEVLPR